MIPKIIHQTWHSPIYSRGDGTPESWKSKNPDWEYKLWLDQDLEDFVEENYPNFIELYRSYPKAVQRTDLGRYLLMHHFGGIYADMDTDCLASLDCITHEDRIVLCDEPREHWEAAYPFGMDHLVFNGTFASPAKHPFWLHLAAMAERNKHAAIKNVILSTGPILMTAAMTDWPNQEDFALNSCHLFAPTSKGGELSTDAVEGDYAALHLSRHNWSGSWYGGEAIDTWRSLKGVLREAKVKLKNKVKPLSTSTLPLLDRELLLSKPSVLDSYDLPQVAIFIPIKDGAPFLERHMELICGLNWPKDRLRLVYCEGDSSDDSRAQLEALKVKLADTFAGFEILTHNAGLKLARKDRWHKAYQLQRRSVLASVRNTLIDKGLTADDEWVLWLDVDVCDFSSDILHTLLKANEKIVVPNCVLEEGGLSFDLNSFLEAGEPTKNQFYKYVYDGLFQPPSGFWARLHMHDLKYAEKVPLTSVGGAMLLVHGSVHRAGLRFPEQPYRYLIETEGFSRMAVDAGLTPYGLPLEEVFHVNS